jgi:predicted transglutaminase-like cysteine proteinase
MQNHDNEIGTKNSNGRTFAGLAFAMAVLSCPPALAGMQMAGPGLAPQAFYKFCERDPINCNSTSGAKVVQLTPHRKSELALVNAVVNRRIRETSDFQTRGVEDDWRQGISRGDCEDFAIAKKSALLKRGWPASALLLTVVRERFGAGGHTVLTVRTSKGDLVLDSRSGRVKDWMRTPYRYYARQSQSATGQWELITR